MRSTLILFLVLLPEILTQQSNIDKLPYQTVIISTSGLNVREAASLDSPIIARIPYGEEVQVLNQVNEQDTFNIKSKKGNDINGFWVEVEYQKTNGYVFSAYLKPSYLEFPQKLIDPGYALLIENCVCNNVFNYNPGLNWYGIFADAGRSDFIIEQIVPSFYKTAGAMGDLVCIESDSESKSTFILGCKESIKVGAGYFSGSYVENSWEEPINYKSEVFMESEALYYCHDNVDLELESPSGLSARGLVWEGDLNGDGVNEFIIQFGSAKYGKLGLFFSDKTSIDAPYRMVAEFTLSYCC